MRSRGPHERVSTILKIQRNFQRSRDSRRFVLNGGVDSVEAAAACLANGAAGSMVPLSLSL